MTYDYPGARSLTNDLFEAAERGDLKDVKHLLARGCDPKADSCWALQTAAGNGHLEVVKLLLPLSDPKAGDSMALWLAAERGHVEIVNLLFRHSDSAKVIEDLASEELGGCDLLVAKLSHVAAKLFMTSHPELEMPRTRAMLAVEGLRRRRIASTSLMRRRA